MSISEDQTCDYLLGSYSPSRPVGWIGTAGGRLGLLTSSPAPSLSSPLFPDPPSLEDEGSSSGGVGGGDHFDGPDDRMRRGIPWIRQPQ